MLIFCQSAWDPEGLPALRVHSVMLETPYMTGLSTVSCVQGKLPPEDTVWGKNI